MPLLPWKKAKVTRISQLVADLQSPKHGGSLVVQTGFPNSLIDLFVKNRDRLKTKPPSIKKHNTNKNKTTKIKKKKNINSVEVSDPEILPPASPPPPPPPSNYVDSLCFWGPAVSRIESHGCRQSCAGAGGGDVDGDLVVDDDHVVVVADAEKDHVKRSGSSGVFVAILKMLILIAVVVAMATKKLAVGITLSAFVLLFIEYAVGKQTVCYFESYSKTLANLRFLIRQDRIADFEQPCAVMKKEGGLDFNHDGAAIEEIEIEGNKTEVVVVQHDQIRATEADFDTLNRDKRLGYEETTIRKLIMAEEYEDGVGESIEQKKRRRNRSAKFKAKMKKLVPNKYRDSKKEKNCKERVPAEVSSICHDHENGLGKEIEIDKNNSSHSLSEQKQCAKDQEEKIGDEVRHSSRIIMMAAATSIGSEKMGMEKKRSLRSLVLILLILAGLVGGRAVAVVLTFGWWLCLKSVATLKRRSNVPMIRGLLSKLSQE